MWKGPSCPHGRIVMDILVFKVISTPLLLLAATLAVRRWGESVGGFIVGLPLTSGPISIFLALDQGPRFAREATSGSLSATTAQAVFCVAYCGLANRGWLKALVGATAIFAITATVLQSRGLPSIELAAIAVVTMMVALYLMPKNVARTSAVRLPWWDLPLRMALITFLVVGVTLVAPLVGPGVSGVLAAFPLIATILAVFGHRTVGPEAAKQVLRGMTAGLFGFIAFFFVVSQALEQVTLPWVYLTAVLCSLAVQGAYWYRSHRHPPLPRAKTAGGTETADLDQ